MGYSLSPTNMEVNRSLLIYCRVFPKAPSTISHPGSGRAIHLPSTISCVHPPSPCIASESVPQEMVGRNTIHHPHLPPSSTTLIHHPHPPPSSTTLIHPHPPFPSLSSTFRTCATLPGTGQCVVFGTLGAFPGPPGMRRGGGTSADPGGGGCRRVSREILFRLQHAEGWKRRTNIKVGFKPHSPAYQFLCVFHGGITPRVLPPWRKTLTRVHVIDMCFDTQIFSLAKDDI